MDIHITHVHTCGPVLVCLNLHLEKQHLLTDPHNIFAFHLDMQHPLFLAVIYLKYNIATICYLYTVYTNACGEMEQG